MASSKIGPASKKHEMFLKSDARLIVYGGAAGGGKTHVGLMRHIRFTDDPNYVGYVIRKNSTAIMKAGSVFDEAVEMYKKVDPNCQIKLKDQKIVFSSGASITFSHYENDTAGKELYRGLQISGIMYDEASQATADQIFWLLSRNRSKSKHLAGIWLTANPDPDSYLFEWVKWYLYPKGHPLEGRPDPDKDGKIRWMLRRGNDFVWADSKEELIAIYGKKILPIQFQFISATIKDNPPLIESNPEYLANLESLGRIEKERMLYGNWLAREDAAGFFKRQWVTEIDEVPYNQIVKTYRAWDIAGSLPSEAEPDPDFTAGVKMSKLRDGSYLIWDVIRFRARYGDVTNRILKIAREDGKNVDILIPQDPGAAGKAAAGHMVQEIIEAGFYARKRPTNKSKVERFRPFAASAENGVIKILKNCGNDPDFKNFETNEFFYKELEQFNGGRKGHDDICDAISDAFVQLATTLNMPIFNPPPFQQLNPFKRT